MIKKGLAIFLLVLATLPAFAQFVAQDPTRYVPNARVLGLGKAFYGAANDSGAIFTNPAGLGEATGWQITSMSGKLLEEYSYLSFSGYYPTDYGVFGFAFAGTSIAGAFATTIEAGSDPKDPLYTIDTTQPQMGNYNNAFTLTYANQLSKVGLVPKFSFSKDIFFGLNIKAFRAALYGDGIVGGDASGSEIDLGIKYKALKWLELGAAAKNALPASSFGGKLKYASGHEEIYPTVINIGSSIAILGKENALFKNKDNSVNVLADIELHPTLKSYPAVTHFGAEWHPSPIFVLRAGLDQDIAGDGLGNPMTSSDFAYGLGLNISGFNFDYAYHTFAGAPGANNSFFSLSYSFSPPPPFESRIKGALVDTNVDNFVTFESSIKLTGKVVDPRVRRLTVNDNPLKFKAREDFSTDAGLKVGKNSILFEGFGNKDIKLGEQKVKILRLQTFPDVPSGHWAAQPISLLSMANVLSGYQDKTFQPEGNITRAEMSSLLTKTVESKKETNTEAKPVPSFKDLPASHWAAGFINQASQLGVVKGFPDNRFQPNGKINRAEGLVMICRLAGISEEGYTVEFPDLYPEHWASGYVAGAYRLGVLNFLRGGFFSPNKFLTRAETAQMLYGTLYMQNILNNNLLDWQNY